VLLIRRVHCSGSQTCHVSVTQTLGLGKPPLPGKPLEPKVESNIVFLECVEGGWASRSSRGLWSCVAPKQRDHGHSEVLEVGVSIKKRLKHDVAEKVYARDGIDHQHDQ
jgi:hypothetical protein